MAEEPKISIVIPTFNRAEMFQEALDSALAQTYANLEVVVADNASTDGTEEAAASRAADARLRYFRNPSNLGMVGNWRKAMLDYATGEWFLILSDDDLLIDRGYIKLAAGMIRENPDMTLVYADGYRRAGSSDTPLNLPFRGVEDGKKIFLSRDSVGRQDFMLCNVLFNRQKAIELGAFTERHTLTCDTDLFLRLCLLGKVGFIDRPVAAYRIHENNLIQNYQSDTDLLLGHIEGFTRPYKMAVEKGLFSQQELRDWRKRVIIGQLKSVYKAILLRHRRNALKLTKEMAARADLSLLEFIAMNLSIFAEYAAKRLSAFFSSAGKGGGAGAGKP